MKTSLAFSAIVILFFQYCVNCKIAGASHRFDSSQTYSGNSTSEIETALNVTAEAVIGNIVRAEKKFAKDNIYWETEVITNSGSSLKLNIDISGQRIFGIKSEDGPFDYELIAGENLISFSDAKQNAESTSGSKVLKWKLVETKSGLQYHFWIFTKGGAAQFKLDAATGERIMKKSPKKKK